MKNVARKNRNQGQIWRAEETRGRGDRQQGGDAGTLSDLTKSIDQLLPECAAVVNRMGDGFLSVKANQAKRNHHRNKRNSVGIKATREPKEFEPQRRSYRTNHAR